MTSPTSPRAACCQSGCRAVDSIGASGRTPVMPAPVAAGAISELTVGPLRGAEAARHPQRQQPVDGDGQQQHPAGDGLVPEGRDPDRDQALLDGIEQQRPERRADHRAAAAEDRDPADHGGGYHIELVADPGAVVYLREQGEEERTAQARQGAAGDEGREHPPAARYPGQRGGIGVGPDRVELAGGAEGPHHVAHNGDHRGHDDRQPRDAEHRLVADLNERVRHLAGRHDVAVHQLRVQAADDVQHRQRDDQARHPDEGGDGPVDGADRRPEGDRDYEPGPHRDVLRPEQVAHDERAQAESRPDRQVHVAGDEDHRLPDAEQRHQGRADQQLLDAAAAGEVVVLEGGDEEYHQHEGQGPGFPGSQGAREPGYPGRPHGRQGRHGRGRGGHAAACATWPVAARMILSSVASARANSPVSRPSWMTRMRSATPSTSGSSDEIISTAIPSAASWSMIRCTSALVPTSMPLVGSSMISSEGDRASHFPSTTFCWLPPDRVDTMSRIRPYRRCSRSAQVTASRRSAPRKMNPALLSLRSDASAMLWSIPRSMTRPCCRRSSGTNAMPAAMAAAGEPFGSAWPSSRTEPAVLRSIPKIARATSVRPAPTRPARATTSPRRTVELTD